MHLVSAKLFPCMAVIRKKWRYGFKPAKEVVPVCHTRPYRPTPITESVV